MKKRQARRPRSRNGCIQCKAKHKACDEEKPFCRNCLDKNILCQYAGTIKKFVDGGNLRQGELKIELPGTADERRYLDFFIKKTTQDFTSLFTSEVWLQTILQLGVYDSPIRHAITAIGSIHFGFLQRQYDAPSQAFLVPNAFALTQYGTSIQQLRHAISKRTCSPLLAVLCCAMFMLFDSFRGASIEAIMHLSNGARILYSLFNPGKGQDTSAEKTSLQAVRHLFIRVAIQIKFEVKDLVSDSNDQASIITELGLTFDIISQLIVPMPDDHAFSSLEEARDSLNEIIILAFANFYQSSPLYKPHINHHQSHLRQLRYKMLANFASWDRQFATYINDSTSFVDVRSQNAAMLLRMCWQSTYNQFAILLDPDSNGSTVLDDQNQWRFLTIQSPTSSNPTSPSTDLSIVHTKPTDKIRNLFTDITPRFETVLNLAEQLLDNQILPIASAQPGIPDFYPDIGVISEVYISGMLCSDTAIRDRAISILTKYSRREGGWDSLTCAKALATMTIGEKDMHEASIIERASYGAF